MRIRCVRYSLESDLKGHPKLNEYCGCFGQAFAEHVMKELNAGAMPGKQMSIDDSIKRDLALRNGCRRKLGLPPAK